MNLNDWRHLETQIGIAASEDIDKSRQTKYDAVERFLLFIREKYESFKRNV